MIPVHVRDELRAADEAAIAEVGLETLVERAGGAVANAALSLLGGGYGKRAVVVAGRGHNGDDGRVAAGMLRRRGVRVAICDPTSLPAELPACDLVIDAAYGTGFRGEYRAPAVPAGTPVLAIDIPSGLDADTGLACEGAVRATGTVTMAALKPGLLMGDGPALAGEVKVAPIGITVAPGNLWLIEDSDLASWLPAREHDTNKWRSAVVVVAGSPGMVGAARFSTAGAQRAGAGMVRWCVPGAAPGSLPVSEAVARSVPAGDFADAVLQELHRCRALVIGPGLGSESGVAASVRRLVAEAEVPVVVDADGLSALGSAERASSVLVGRKVPAVLTPHDGEYKRLMGATAGGDGRPGGDRVAAARLLASRTGAIVLLKGSTTAVAAPDGECFLVTSGSPRLATAGTGDVLSGIVGAFMARGVDPLRAAALAAHVHGRAAASGFAEGLLAGDLPELVAAVLSNARG
ncbi:MAG TPA: NAD(P)H-hydrate dehydratase [Acidimicrobiales bacterium]|nr:NAD(P)H-hydrate dehydratase [Acidimicrobiales bacterium]